MNDLLDMILDKVSEVREKVDEMSPSEKESVGEKALQFIGDYPLYGATSNISYEEAIVVALCLGGEDFINLLVED